ncbi:MAG: hypothetical protein ACKV22_27035 [Bryobacteraceae bacterium]
MTHPYIAALDLGRERDHSALAIVERRVIPLGFDPVYFCQRTECQVWLRELVRFPLGTPYREVVGSVSQRLHAAPFTGRTPLVVDSTGVGAAVVEMLRDTTLPLVPVILTGGEHVNYSHSHTHAPKQDVVTALAVLLEQRKFFADRALPLASAFLREMETFQARSLPSGRVRLQARREADHDDLVMAVALASWQAVRQWPEILRQDPLPRPSEAFYL